MKKNKNKRSSLIDIISLMLNHPNIPLYKKDVVIDQDYASAAVGDESTLKGNSVTQSMGQ